MAAIQEYIQRTLLFHTMDRQLLDALVRTTIEDLVTTGMITVDSTGSYAPTLLSQATIASSLTPDDGIFVHGELQRALRAFVMDGEMHIFYMFTPVQLLVLGEISWPIFRREMDGLNESGMRVLEFVGVNPGLVNRLYEEHWWCGFEGSKLTINRANSAKPLPEGTPDEVRTARVYRRSYAAFQLRDLCNEVPIHVVAKKYDIPRGFVQTLAQTCEGFAVGMISFCDRMGWGMLKSVLEHMVGVS